MAVRAASMAVLPPPYTATRRPSSGRSPSSSPCSSETASSTLAAEAGGQVGAPAELGADGQEDGVPALLRRSALSRSVTGVVQLEVHAEGEHPVDLGVEHLARQPVARDAVAHHPARGRMPTPGS